MLAFLKQLAAVRLDPHALGLEHATSSRGRVGE
jgi:hypothetical protein